MDIYEYINSQDIRKHLKKINYEFTPIEKVFLIWQSRHHTIEEKHKAYFEIIKKTPDFILNLNDWNYAQIKMADFLLKYIEIENKLIEKFDLGRNAVYSYVIGSFESRVLYEHYEVCAEAIKNDIRNKLNEKRVVICRFTERERTDSERNIRKYLSEKNQCVFVSEELFLKGEKQKIFNLFNRMHFDIPLPFETGDAIIERYGGAECKFYYYPERIDYSKNDMSMWYFGKVKYEDVDMEEDDDIIVENYLNLEYYCSYMQQEKLSGCDLWDLPF